MKNMRDLFKVASLSFFSKVFFKYLKYLFENNILRLTFLVSLLSLFYTVERVCDKDEMALEYLEIKNYLNF